MRLSAECRFRAVDLGAVADVLQFRGEAPQIGFHAGPALLFDGMGGNEHPEFFRMRGAVGSQRLEAGVQFRQFLGSGSAALFDFRDLRGGFFQLGFEVLLFCFAAARVRNWRRSPPGLFFPVRLPASQSRAA